MWRTRLWITPRRTAGGRRPRALFVVHLTDELLDAFAAIDRLVVGEAQLRRDPQLELHADLVTEKPPGLVQAPPGMLALLGVAMHGPEHPRLAQVGRHLHPRDRYQPDAGVAHAAGEQLPEQLLDHLRHALGPVVAGHSRSSSFSQPGSRSPGSSSSSRSGGSRVRSCASKSGFWDQSAFISE